MDVNRTIAKSIVNIEILLSKVGLGFMDGVIDTVAISSEVLRPEVVQVLAGLTRRVYRPLRGTCSRSLFSGFYNPLPAGLQAGSLGASAHPARRRGGCVELGAALAAVTGRRYRATDADASAQRWRQTSRR